MKKQILRRVRSATYTAMMGMVVLMLAVFVNRANAQTDISPNGNFENSAVTVGTDTSGVEGWTFELGGDAAANFSVVDDTVQEGNRALRVEVDTLGSNDWDIQAVNETFPVEPGLTYTLSVWARTASGEGQASFTAGNPAFNEFGRIGGATVNSTWQKYTLKFDVPAGSTVGRIPIHFSMDGNAGKVFYLDNIKVMRPYNNDNGDFEASALTVGDDTSGVRGWTFLVDAGDANFKIVDDPVKSGSRALAATINSTGSNSWDIQAVNDSIPVIPGQEYTYSVWVRSDADGAAANFTVGNPSYDEHLRTEVTDISTSWQEVTGRFTVPAGDTSIARGPIHLSMDANTGNTIYIDNLRIKEYSEPVIEGAPVIVEAESGDIGSEFEEGSDGDTTYIAITTDYDETTGTGDYPGANRTASYQVTFPDTGSYDLFVKLRVGPNTFDDDSWFYGLGFGEKAPDSAAVWATSNGLATAGYSDPQAVVRDAGGLGENVWKWVNVSRNAYQGDTTYTFVVDDPNNLTRTFQIGARENGLWIDKFAFGSSHLFYTVENLNNGEAGSETDPRTIPSSDPIAKGKAKFLGNVYSQAQAEYFTNYWNQVTPENAGKWGSVEGNRDQMNWNELDNAYDLAKDHGFPFRFHVLVWGQQQPSWMSSLSPDEQKAEIREWFEAVAERYPDIDYLEVVNEALPGHNQPSYKGALGGDGDTGFDWVIEAFKMANDIFPDSTKFMINDYGIVGNSSATNSYINLINLLKDRDLIDGIGVQAHAFSTGASASTMKSNLDKLGNTGLFVMATEMDIDGDPNGTMEESDQRQLDEYKRIFPVFWKHPDIEGITLWGWKQGMWRSDQEAYLYVDQRERPALEWLRSYVDTASTNTAIEEPTADLPKRYKLHNNYPNPFNPTTQIKFDIPEKANVTLQVYDITGRLVQTLVSGIKNPGSYTVTFRANQLSSGVYLYRLKAGSFTKVQQMMLIK